MADSHWHEDARFDEGCEGCQADVLAGQSRPEPPQRVTVGGRLFVRHGDTYRPATYAEAHVAPSGVGRPVEE